MGSSVLVELVNNVGVNVALIVFFVWQGKRFLDTMASRNEALSSSFHDLERETRETLVKMVQDCTRTTEANTAVNRETIRVISDLIVALRQKPCMYHGDLPEQEGSVKND